MRVGIILNKISFPERIGLTLIEKLKERGYEVYLACGNVLNPEDILKSSGRALEKHVMVDGIFKLNTISLYGFCQWPVNLPTCEFLRKMDVIVKLRGAFIPLPGKPYILYDFTGKVVHNHGSQEKLGLLSLKMYFKFLRDCFNTDLTLVCPSEYAKRLAKNLGFHAVVIPPPVDTKKFLPLARIRNRKNIIVSIGAFEPVKRHRDQVDILASLLKRGENVRLVMIGRAEKNNTLKIIKKYARKIGVFDYLTIETAVPLRRLQFYLSQAKILLHTRIDEYFGISILEGMCAGLIPVVHDSGGPVDYVPPSFRFKNLDEAGELIINYLDDKIYQEQRERTITIARSFDEGFFAESMINLINKMGYKKKAPTSPLIKKASGIS